MSTAERLAAAQATYDAALTAHHEARDAATRAIAARGQAADALYAAADALIDARIAVEQEEAP